MSEKESDDPKSLKNKNVKEEHIEKINEEISSNMRLLNDKFNNFILQDNFLLLFPSFCSLIFFLF
jgi:hypothetical protein